MQRALVNPPMDAVKREYIDRYIRTELLPENADVDLSRFLTFLEANPEHDDHKTRFLSTYAEVMRRVNPQRSWEIAETGHLSAVSRFLQNDGYDLTELDGDFRYRINSDSERFDLILSFEVFEHIKDQDSTNFDDIVLFNFSGVQAFISELHRCLKPGGTLAISTPNACALVNLERLVNYEAPMMFWPHVKEYAPAQMISAFESVGFETLSWGTFYGLFHLYRETRERLLCDLIPSQAARENRGDIAIYVFRKS